MKDIKESNFDPSWPEKLSAELLMDEKSGHGGADSIKKGVVSGSGLPNGSGFPNLWVLI